MHGARPAAGQSDDSYFALATASTKGPSAAQLPVLSPAAESVAKPQPSGAARVSAPSAQSPVPDPGARLASAAAAATAPPVSSEAPEKGRLSRARALPEVPLAAGPANGQAPVAAAQTPVRPLIANTLDSQYVEHTIVSGESLSSIAAGYGMTVTSIVANNPGLDDLDIIHTGQTLRIPTTNGLLYHVQAGDTLDGIARRYGVPLQDVLNLPANGLQDADIIKPGQTILLPGDIRPPPPPVVAKALPAAPQTILQTPSQPSQNSGSPAAPAPTPVVPVARFIWPVQGPVTQGFGVPELGVGAPHTGIDIGLYGRNGAPIAAAAGGTVSFSGGDACCGYGYYVVIKHAGGFTSLYGHLSRRAVSVGDAVTQGQTIGYAGSTGFSTGTHLHFEITLNGSLQNPLRYLP